MFCGAKMLCCGRKKDCINAQSTPVAGHFSSSIDAVRTRNDDLSSNLPWYDDRSLSRSMASTDRSAAAGHHHHLDSSGPVGGSSRTATLQRHRGAASPWNDGSVTRTRRPVHSSHVDIGSGPVEMGIRSIETHADYIIIETVEIVKRPGQSLGFYIREGNGVDRSDGVFISRIASCSAVDQNGLLRVGEEIIAVDGVDVTRMSLDDVVIRMSLPRRLLLTVRTRRSCCNKNLSCPALLPSPSGDGVSTLGQTTTKAVPVDGRPRDGVGRRAEHQRHWSTASVVDLTDNYVERQPTSADYRRRNIGLMNREETTASLVRGGRVLGPPWSEHQSSLSRRTVGQLQPETVVPVEVHRHFHQAPPQTTTRVFRQKPGEAEMSSESWNRRRAADTNFSVFQTSTDDGTLYGLRRPLRYPLDYSSDTEAPYVGQLLPPEWRRPPMKSAVKVEVEPPTFEQEWPPTVNGKRRRHASEVDASSHRNESLSTDETSMKASKQHISDSDLNGVGEDDGYLGLLAVYGSDRPEVPATSNIGSGGRRRVATGSAVEQGSAQQPSTENGSGSGSGNSSTKSDELRHWLRKLDNLSFQLQEFNDRDRNGAVPSSKPQSSTHQELGSVNVAPTDVVGSERHRRHIDDASAHRRVPSAPETYSASEYRTWSRDKFGRSPSAGSQRRKSVETVTAGHLRLVPDVASGDGAIVSSHPSASLSRRHRLRPTVDAAQGLSRLPVPQVQPGTYRRLDSSGIIRVGPPEAARSASSEKRAQVRNQDWTALSKTPLTKKPLKIRLEEFRPYRSVAGGGTIVRHDRRNPETNGLVGLLSVHVYCGYGLRIAPTALRDLYCVVGVDSENRARTALQSGAVNFDWDELFDVDVLDARTVSFNIYSWSRGSKQRLHFTGLIDLTDPSFAPPVLDKGIPSRLRLAVGLEPTGVLYIELIHGDLSFAYRRTPAPSAVACVAVFGVDLDDLVARERADGSSGVSAEQARGHLIDVPAIVRRCVDEVERRGLEAVGVYRLCCGVRRKRQLKAELEADVVGVALTADYVPDINVVTCVLKDFFIELPEPLFTNGLYQLLLDAMAVQMDNDPRGNADIMYGIMDCLPRVNQATLTFMLDHLKRVTRRSDVNRMTSLALARIFGPLFICPPYRLVRQVPVDLNRHAELLCYVLEIWPPTVRR